MRVVGVLSLVWVLGCGGSSENGSAEAETGGEQPVENASVDPVEPDVAWADMTEDQKFAFMQNTVVPEMQGLFQEFDGERFADFGCPTCHGANAQEVGFSMPNGIAPLNPEHVPGMFQSDQPMAQFMVQRVWPRMVEMLGAEPYDAETQQGFGCFGCHGMQQ